MRLDLNALVLKCLNSLSIIILMLTIIMHKMTWTQMSLHLVILLAYIIVLINNYANCRNSIQKIKQSAIRKRKTDNNQNEEKK